jgi:hypothetical protein
MAVKFTSTRSILLKKLKLPGKMKPSFQLVDPMALLLGPEIKDNSKPRLLVFLEQNQLSLQLVVITKAKPLLEVQQGMLCLQEKELLNPNILQVYKWLNLQEEFYFLEEMMELCCV